VTTYDEIIKAAGYYFKRQYVFPTIKQIRNILQWLEAEGMIQVQPIRKNELPRGADVGAETRAYVGLKIIVIKYDTYQNYESYKGRGKGRPFFPEGHNNNNGYNNGHKTPIAPFEYPEWLNTESWTDFKEHRKEIKAPMTERAEKKNITVLKKLIDEGYSQAEVIDQSIANGWKGLFPIKDKAKKGNTGLTELPYPKEVPYPKEITCPEEVSNSNPKKIPSFNW